MLQDPLALQAAERSFYNALIGQDHLPNSSRHFKKITQNPAGFTYESDLEFNSSGGRKHHPYKDELEERCCRKSAEVTEMLNREFVVDENGDRVLCCPLDDPIKRKEYEKLIEQDRMQLYMESVRADILAWKNC